LKKANAITLDNDAGDPNHAAAVGPATRSIDE